MKKKNSLVMKYLANRQVKIAIHQSDTLNYLYSTITDKDGYFAFTNLDKEKQYDVFFSDTIGSVKYLAVQTLTPPNDKLQLLATNDNSKQNGILITVMLNNQPVNISNVCVFNNLQLFQADTGCTGSILHGSTDVGGKKIFYNVGTGTFYIRASYNSGSTTYKGNSEITTGNNGISSIQINLSAVVPSNELNLLVLDNFNTPVRNTEVCLFNSYSVFNSDTTCNASYRHDISNENGKIRFTNLAVGKYYMRAKFQNGGLTLRGVDSVDIGNGVKLDTVILK